MADSNVVPIQYRPSCQDCTWWQKLEDRGEARAPVGECRLEPPKIYILPASPPPAAVMAAPQGRQAVAVSVTPLCPRTEGDFWCGQHQYFDQEEGASPDAA